MKWYERFHVCQERNESTFGRKITLQMRVSSHCFTMQPSQSTTDNYFCQNFMSSILRKHQKNREWLFIDLDSLWSGKARRLTLLTKWWLESERILSGFIHGENLKNYFHVQCVKQTNGESHRSTRTEWNVCRRGKLSAQFWHEIIIKALLVGKFPSGQFGDSGLKEAARGTTRKEKEELRRISVRMPVDHQIIGARLREIGDEVNQSGQRNRSSTSEQILFLMLFLILLRTPCPIQHKRKDWSGLRKNILFQV